MKLTPRDEIEIIEKLLGSQSDGEDLINRFKLEDFDALERVANKHGIERCKTCKRWVLDSEIDFIENCCCTCS